MSFSAVCVRMEITDSVNCVCKYLRNVLESVRWGKSRSEILRLIEETSRKWSQLIACVHVVTDETLGEARAFPRNPKPQYWFYALHFDKTQKRKKLK